MIPFKVIHQLIQRVRQNDEEARLVLHDALIERYGETYLMFVRAAQRGFVGEKRTMYVAITKFRDLRSFDAWRKEYNKIFHHPPPSTKGDIPFEVIDHPTRRGIVTYVFDPRATRDREGSRGARQ